MAKITLEIVADIEKGTAAIRRIGDETERMAGRTRVAAGTAKQATDKMADVTPIHAFGKAWSATTFEIQKFVRVAVSLQVIGATIVGALAIREILRAADAWTLLSARLGLVSGAGAELAATQAQLFRLAQELRTPLDSITTLYTRLAINTENLNLNQTQLLSVTRAVSQAMTISGSTAQETSAGVIQLTQALASNRFAGDELRTLLESQPRLLKAFGDGLKGLSPEFKKLVDGGMTVTGALRKMGEQGKLTSDLLIAALLSQMEILNAEFKRFPVTVEGAWTQVTNTLTRLAGSFDVQPVIRSLQELRKHLEDPIVMDQLIANIDLLMLRVGNVITVLDGFGRTLLNLGDYLNIPLQGLKILGATIWLQAQLISSALILIVEATARMASMDMKGAAEAIKRELGNMKQAVVDAEARYRQFSGSAAASLERQSEQVGRALGLGVKKGLEISTKDVKWAFKQLEADLMKSFVLKPKAHTAEDIKKQVNDAVARIQAQTALLRSQAELSEVMGEISREERLQREIAALNAEDVALGKLLPSLKAGTAEHAKLATMQIQAALAAEKLTKELRAQENQFTPAISLTSRLVDQIRSRTTAEEMVRENITLTNNASAETLALLNELEQHKDLNFVQRILRPEDFSALQTETGEFATHMMETAEVMGKFIAYPRVIFDENSKALRDIGDQAIEHALKTGEFIEFQSSEAASRFAQNYKTVWGDFTISQAGVQKASQQHVLALDDVRTAMGRVGSIAVVLSDDIAKIDERIEKSTSTWRDYQKIIDDTTRVELDRIDAMEALKRLTPIDADRQRVAALEQQRALWVKIREQIDPLDKQALKEFDVSLLQVDARIKELRDDSLSLAGAWRKAFDGIFDILSLFGVKLGKVILMLQSIPRALGGLEKIAGAIGGLIKLSSPSFVGAGELLPGLSAAESEIVALGNAASSAGGELGIMGTVINIVTRLLTIFGGGLQAFGSKIGGLLSQIGIPGAEMLGQGIAGGALGFGLGSMFGGMAGTIKSTIYSAVGNMILPGIGGIIGSVVGIIDAKLSSLAANLFGGGKGAEIGAQIGTMVFPVLGTFIGGFIGSLFGSTPKGQLKARFTPFDRTAMGDDVTQHPTVRDPVTDALYRLFGRTAPGREVKGAGVGAAIVNLGGNILGGKKEHRLQKQLAQMLNDLLQMVVTSMVELMKVLPTTLSAELDANLTELEEHGLMIVNKKWKGGSSAKKLKRRIKGLTDEAIENLVEALGFGDLDLKALGGGKRGDAAKGFDSMMMSLTVMSTLIKETKANMDGYNGTLADFTKASVDYFKQFQKEGETFADTVKRVGDSLFALVATTEQIEATIAATTQDTVLAMQLLEDALARVNERAIAAMDSLTVEVESGASPDDVKAAAEAAMQAVVDAMNAQIEAATRLRDAVLAIEQAMNEGIDAYIDLEIQIRELGGATMGLEATLPGLIDLFNYATSIGQQIALFAAGAKLMIAEGHSLISQMPLIAEGFNRIMTAIKELSDPQEAVGHLQALAQAINQSLAAGIAAIQQATQLRIAALESEKDAIRRVTEEKINALEAEKDRIRDVFAIRREALEKELEQARKWNGILDSVRGQLVDLKMLLAPTQPLTNLNATRSEFQALYEKFLAKPTPELSQQLQDMARQLIQLAQMTPGYDLSSHAFRDLAAYIKVVLTAIESFAATQPREEDIQKKIADLNAEEASALKSIDAQITALRASEAAQLAAIDQQIAALNAAAQVEIQQLKDAAVAGLIQIRDELGKRLLELQQAQQDAAAALKEVIGDKTYEQYIAERQAEAVERLTAINQTLKDYLGAILENAFPGATLPSHAGGLDYVPYDNYIMRAHKGETVLNAQDAAVYRSGASGTTISLNFGPGSVVIPTTGRESDSEMQRKVDDALAAVLRSGVSKSRGEILRLAKTVSR